MHTVAQLQHALALLKSQTAKVTGCEEAFQQELTGESCNLDVAETALLCAEHVIGADVGQLLCLQPSLRLSSSQSNQICYQTLPG